MLIQISIFSQYYKYSLLFHHVLSLCQIFARAQVKSTKGKVWGLAYFSMHVTCVIKGSNQRKSVRIPEVDGYKTHILSIFNARLQSKHQYLIKEQDNSVALDSSSFEHEHLKSCLLWRRALITMVEVFPGNNSLFIHPMSICWVNHSKVWGFFCFYSVIFLIKTFPFFMYI